MKILLAEDDLLSGAILRALLTKLGHEPILAKDGAEAFQLFQTTPTEVVISDWLMPGMTGLELCRAIRALPLRNYTYFILQTSKTSDASYQEAMDAEVDDFLPKPVKRNELSHRIRVAERMIRQRREALQQISRLARFPEDNPNPVLQLNLDATVLYTNTAAQRCLAGLHCEVGRPAPPRLKWLVKQLFESGSHQEVELTLNQRVFSFTATSIVDQVSTYVYGHDITDRKRAEFEIIQLKDDAIKLALHDQLTGLPNRVQLGTRLEQAQAHARRHQQRFALLMVDIDNFKSVNDGLGHDAGDRLIQLVARTLQAQLRTTDMICRWGGDELVILLTELDECAAVAPVCERLSNAIKAAVAQEQATVTISIGYAVFPDQSEDPELLVQQADQALYDAKDAGRNCWREFTQFPAGEIRKSAGQLFFRLSNAVREDLLTVHYQPVIDAVTGLPRSLEALVRWEDAEFGRVSPDQFIPLAEEKGLIVTLGRQVMAKSLCTAKHWRNHGWPVLMAVNLSRLELVQPDFPEQVMQAVEAGGLAPENLSLEITEREAFIQDVNCRRNLELLARFGFRLSLDDFGAGFSTFEALSDLPFHQLKLNMGLVRNSENPRVARIIEAIVGLGLKLDLEVVGEGVETAAQRDFLADLGVGKLQGYLFSRPLDAEGLAKYLEQFPQVCAVAA